MVLICYSIENKVRYRRRQCWTESLSKSGYAEYLIPRHNNAVVQITQAQMHSVKERNGDIIVEL
jgi:hypothetical protein